MSEYDDFIRRLALLSKLVALESSSDTDRGPVWEFLESQRQQQEREARGRRQFQLAYPATMRTVAGPSSSSGISGLQRTAQAVSAASEVSGALGGPTLDTGLQSILTAVAK